MVTVFPLFLFIDISFCVKLAVKTELSDYTPLSL